MLGIKETWDKALETLEKEVTAVSFDLWIKTLEPIDFRDGVFYLSATSETAKTRVKKLHSAQINFALKEINPLIENFEVLDPDEVKEFESKPAEPQAEENLDLCKFQEKYTFDNYVVGNSNKFVYAAARGVAENPTGKINPLFIYGGSGLGKTHLLHAIGNYITENKPELNVVYVTTEQFTNEFIETVGKNELNLNSGFRNKYRNADVLIVDDVQSIIGKPRVQEEFFHTFNALTSQNKQIVLSSDRPPKEINPLEERLRSRFEWGLITDIGVPEIETRIAILKKKCIIDRQVVDDEVLQYISEAMTSNVRELEGFLSRCVFYAGLLKKPKVTIDVAKEALKNYITVTKVTYDSDKILEKVCSYFEISKNQLLGKDRRKELSYARQIAMYLLDELMNMPYTSIGKIFGKDHATVIYCKNKVASELKTNKLLETQVKDIKGLCGAKLD